MVNEVVTQKTSITTAANATSVIGALVATTSFIGPLQPPLSYIGDGGYIDTTQSIVRLYLVCNNLSFFFSNFKYSDGGASCNSNAQGIHVWQAFEKPKMFEGKNSDVADIYHMHIHKLFIYKHCTVCLEWHYQQLVVIVFGGEICVVVLAVYIIRLLQMMFHKNDHFRRRFKKYMYFWKFWCEVQMWGFNLFQRKITFVVVGLKRIATWEVLNNMIGYIDNSQILSQAKSGALRTLIDSNAFSSPNLASYLSKENWMYLFLLYYYSNWFPQCTLSSLEAWSSEQEPTVCSDIYWKWMHVIPRS